jgi:Putative transposase
VLLLPRHPETRAASKPPPSHNKTAAACADRYDLLFKASAETMLIIGDDPEHLGARIGFISVLHTRGSAMTHHPHVHMIAPGGGISPDGTRWIASRRGFFLPVLVLSALFRRLMLEKLAAAHKAGKLRFFGEHAHLASADAFARFLAPLRKTDWFVYSKRPFSGPKAVLAYLSRYTHHVAISNRRLVAADSRGVTFKYKDYRIEGPGRYKKMTLETGEFIRRFLILGFQKSLPCAAKMVPSHPPLRASGQRYPRRKSRHDAHPDRHGSAGIKESRLRQWRCACRRSAGQALPVLRQPDADRRVLRGPMPEAGAGASADGVRHVMTSGASASTPIATRLYHRSSAGHGGACSFAAQEPRLEPWAGCSKQPIPHREAAKTLNYRAATACPCCRTMPVAPLADHNSP